MSSPNPPPPTSSSYTKTVPLDTAPPAIPAVAQASQQPPSPAGPAKQPQTSTGVPISYDQLGGLEFGILDKFHSAVNNPKALIIFLFVIFLYYIIFTSLGKNGGQQDGSVLESFLWAIFIVIVIVNGFQYFFNKNITAEVKNIFSPNPQIEITQNQQGVENTPGIRMPKQVFHIPANVYDYPEAKAVCDAYGARLATYNEVEEAYNTGGEWCSYGWSDNQMILYPTQKDTWRKLQKIPGKEHACGRPGVNGGFLENSGEKFGVNCYGVKPDVNGVSAKFMSSATPVTGSALNDPAYEKKVQEFRDKINDIVIAPFNNTAWSLV